VTWCGIPGATARDIRATVGRPIHWFYAMSIISVHLQMANLPDIFVARKI
jgi:hypothetical protein